MSIATVGSRFQVVIPAKERKQAGIQPHDKVAVEVEGETIVIRPIDARHLRGLGKELAGKTEPVDYVRELRAEWGGAIVKIPADLRGADDVVVDTNIFIYLLEDHATYGSLAEYLIDEAAVGAFSGVVTPITLAELLVKPLREDRPDIADAYRASLHHLHNIRVVSTTPEIGMMAGALRAKYNLSLADMIQAATALRSDRPTLISNDKACRKVKELRVVTLSEFR